MAEHKRQGLPSSAVPPAAIVPVSRRPEATNALVAPLPEAPARRPQRFWPSQPRSLDETGLTTTLVEELVLKALFFAGELRGVDLAHRLKLPFSLLEGILDGLRQQKAIDIRATPGPVTNKAPPPAISTTTAWQLTPFASDRVRQVLERSRYNGPAPVPIQEWILAVQKQTLRGQRITRQRLQERLGDLVVRDSLFSELGPAMSSGRSVLLYGPAGNGKTALCQRMVHCFEGDVFIPYALLVEDCIIRLFDAVLHKPLPGEPGAPAYDRRWVRCQRPLISVGAELTLGMLELVASHEGRSYDAPLQMKAANGMLLMDDFGRQKISPQELFNRWSLPLESDVDILTLHSGKRIQVPCDVFAAFATNLPPGTLVDDAFLRRIRYKVEVAPPDAALFHRIFQTCCEKRGVLYEAAQVQYLIDTYYTPHGRAFAACQPRDLLEQILDLANYHGIPPVLSPALIDAAARSYFVRFA